MAYEEILTVNSALQSKRTDKTTADSSTTVLKDGEIVVVREGSSKPYDTTIRVGDGTTALKDLKEVGTKYSNATTSAAGLMSAADKTKLDGIDTGANKTTVDSALSSSSTNPVQNKVINSSISTINTNLDAKVDKSNTGVVAALNLLTSTKSSLIDSDVFIAGDDSSMYRTSAGAIYTYTEEKLHPRILNDKDYGTTLPSNPVSGQLYFQETTVTSLVDLVYPVGSIYMSVNSANPASLFGTGTDSWVQLKDRFLLGAGSTYENGATGGKATHTLTVNEMPSHSHDWKGFTKVNYGSTYNVPIAGNDLWSQQGFTGGPQATGGGAAHNNMPPYLVVYMWKRVK